MTPVPLRLGPVLSTNPALLLEDLLAVAVQFLIAENSELLLPPEIPRLHPPPRLAHARTLVALIHETQRALASYRDLSPRPPLANIDASDDDIPF